MALKAHLETLQGDQPVGSLFMASDAKRTTNDSLSTSESESGSTDADTSDSCDGGEQTAGSLLMAGDTELADDLSSTSESESGSTGTDTSDSCDGCTCLHWFMLERLPEVLVAARTSENSSSIENALEHVRHAHEKFMLCQGHQVCVMNQNNQLDKCDEELCERCRKEKNLLSMHTWLIVNFKMKWEPMCQKEETSENCGKCGISWHGN